MNVIRYAIKMKNGNFMVQEFLEGLDRVKITNADLPIDATLLKDKDTAERVIKETLFGGSVLPVEYNKNNPPERVVEVKINFTINE